MSDRRGLTRAFVVVVVVCLMAAGCSGSSDDTENEADDVGVGSTSEPEAVSDVATDPAQGEGSAPLEEAMAQLLSIRRAPTDIELFRTTDQRDVYGAPFVAYGPYPDGPPMAFTTEGAGLATPSAIAEQLDAAADASRLDDRQRAEMRDVLARFAGEPELAARVPSPWLQAVIAYTSAVVARPAALGPGGDGRPMIWTFANAESVPGLDVLALVRADSTYNDDDRPTARATHGFVGLADGSQALTVDPARRFEDVRYGLALVSQRRINCSSFNANCVILRALHTYRTYLDFVLADPGLALADTYSARALNTSVLAFLNSADDGALAPAIEPEQPAVLFPDAESLTTNRPVPDLSCIDAAGEPIDCWELDHVVSDSWLTYLDSRLRGTAVEAGLDAITTDPDLGTTLATIGFESADVTGLSRFDDDGRELVDQHMAEAFPPEDNIVFRLLLGVLDESDLASAAAEAGLELDDLVQHLEKATAIGSLARLLGAEAPVTLASPIEPPGIDIPLEPGDDGALLRQSERLLEIVSQVNLAPDPTSDLWLEVITEEYRQGYNRQSQGLLDEGQGYRNVGSEGGISEYRVRGRADGLAVVEFCLADRGEWFDLETGVTTQEIVGNSMYRQAQFDNDGTWIIYHYVALRNFESVAECDAALANRAG